jgi:uncharacterized protein YndB with AHSA1/START domain
MSIPAQINDVLRRVDLDETGHVVALERTFAAAAEEVWDACTSPARLARWFEPVTGELRLGGRYRMDLSGTEGTVEACEPPARLVVTWEHGGDRSRVTVTLTPLDAASTRLVVAHAGELDEGWQRFGPAAGGTGWDSSLRALALHLAGDEAAAPEAVEAWSTSDEGRRAVEAWVEAWRVAHVAAGVTPEEAAGPAERARAAYLTGEWD